MGEQIAHVGLQELKDLKAELIKISENLGELRQLLDTRLETTHSDWQDGMFDDFEEVFQPHIKMVQELSNKYEEWAKDYIQKRIEIIESQPTVTGR
ncbi:MAG: hypothetical protein IJ724_03590 [Muribaculaceae bacterium]|nr:hypothetical protein [Muribaculaceae bacterium]